MAIRIITDSVSDIPKAYQEQYQIEVLPLMVNFEEESFLDGVDLDTDTFFKKLKTASKLPTTSQVNPGRFIESFEKLIEAGDEAVVILMSSDMSGTYNAALSAVEYLNTDKISVVDSRAISFGYGLLVIEAARMAERGHSRQEIFESIQMQADQMVNLFVVDTLEYLQKGGRLSAGEAFIGNLLSIKPIITIEEGKLKSLDKVRGRKKAFKWVLDYLEKHEIDLKDKTIGIFHADDPEHMEELLAEITARYQPKEIIKSTVGTVVAVHSGPGCVALSFRK